MKDREVSTQEKKRFFHLVFLNEKRKRFVHHIPMGVGRHIIGRVSNCDFQIKSKKISAIHAVLEITPKNIRLYDMNSTNGVFVNGHRRFVSNIEVGDIITFADLEYRVSEAEPKPLPGKIRIPEESKGKVIRHPLETMADIEYCEYIFEEAEEILPIFDYSLGGESLEILILHKDVVISIDYLPLNQREIWARGGDAEESIDLKTAYLPFFKKNDRFKLLSYSGKNYIFHKLDGFIVKKLQRDGIEEVFEDNIILEKNDILKLHRDGLDIYVRKSSRPPFVENASVLRDDDFFKNYVIPTLLVVLLPLLVISFFDMRVEEKKEDKIERVATILYKKNLLVKKKAKSPKNVRAAIPVNDAKQSENLKGKPDKPALKPRKKVEVKKTAKVEKGKRKSSPAKKKPIKRPRSASGRKGKVQGVKNLDFSSSLNTLLVSQSKIGKKRGAQRGSEDTSLTDRNDFSLDEGTGKKLQRIGVDQGESIADGVRSRVTSELGAEGLSDKRSYYIVGLPDNAVVKGSVDGYDIMKKLRRHLSQFRFCVEKQLRPGEMKTGRVTLNFVIGASGYASKVYIPSRTYDLQTRRCMSNVLKGIAFTPPRGGGVADVSVPINFGAR